MTSLKFVLCLSCLFLGKMALKTGLKKPTPMQQERRFRSADVGDTVTLECFYENEDSAWVFWYKQTSGQRPRLMSSFYVYDTKTTFYHEFKNNSRFALGSNSKANNLTISDLQISDSATYYCASSYSFMFEFAEGTTLSIKGSHLNIQALVHQSASETVQPGGSVTLNCTVHTEACDDEHSVYWFRNSEESQPGLIYTHGDRNDQCERKPDTQTHTCFYTLSLGNLNVSHAGTYYCAVASCGHILFGEGTKLELEEAGLAYFWHGVSAFTTILSILLAFSLCMKTKRNSCRSVAPSTVNAEGYQDGKNLYYATLSNLTRRSRGQTDQTWTECVYKRIKL
ncbi:immunoglobulin kappa light chain-like [Toxotes jaculatrix]|uniref:immunoglobulin kappa light chain-like n=1 Tax=Toxotes jaculatrix TaxID=941984 RepID=UPI001B3A8561|nr:immunoglobulin kappa light chain-like [Toxotes jaculatrix]